MASERKVTDSANTVPDDDVLIIDDDSDDENSNDCVNGSTSSDQKVK